MVVAKGKQVNCKTLKFSGHAIRRMFEREINKQDVRAAVDTGEVIMQYPDDQPFPSMLLLGYSKQRPLHVVIGVDEQTETCYVVTVYVPDVSKWEDDLKTRKPE